MSGEITETQVCRHSEETSGARKCDYCGAEEGKPRMVGDFIVSLITLTIEGETKKACQTCYRKHPDLRRFYFKKK